jgi:DNA-binding response OmpR family regulator
MRILFIEDNPADARYVRELLAELESFEFQLLHARWLSTGLDCLAEGGFDIALLDLELPDVAGVSTIEKVRAQAPELPIVVVTGCGEDTVKAAALQAGAQEYLVKGGFDAAVLQQAVLKAFERKRAEERAEG